MFLIVRPFHAFELAEIPPAIIERLGLTTAPIRKSRPGAATALFMIAAWIALYLQGRLQLDTLPAKRPLLSMVFLFWLLCVVAVADMLPALPQAFLWTFLAAFASGFWFLAYALASDQKAKGPRHATACGSACFTPSGMDPTAHWQRRGLSEEIRSQG